MKSIRSVENAAKFVKCRMITLKLCPERRIGKQIPPRHPIMSWPAPHAAANLRYRSTGDDGKTPYEIITLRPFNNRLISFGERCSYKLRAKEPIDQEHKWYQGICLGYAPSLVNICSTASRGTLSTWPERSDVFQIRPSGTQSIFNQCEFHHFISPMSLNLELC